MHANLTASSADVVRAYGVSTRAYMALIGWDPAPSGLTDAQLDASMLTFSDALLDDTAKTWLDAPVGLCDLADTYVAALAVTPTFRTIYSGYKAFENHDALTRRHIMQVPRVYYADVLEKTAEPLHGHFVKSFAPLFEADTYKRKTLPALKKTFNGHTAQFLETPLPLALATDKIGYVGKQASSIFRKTQNDAEYADIRDVPDILRLTMRLTDGPAWEQLKKKLGGDKNAVHYISTTVMAYLSLDEMPAAVKPETYVDRLTKRGKQPNVCIKVNADHTQDGITLPSEMMLALEEPYVNDLTAGLRQQQRILPDSEKDMQALLTATRTELFEQGMQTNYPQIYASRQNNDDQIDHPGIRALHAAVFDRLHKRRAMENKYSGFITNTQMLGQNKGALNLCAKNALHVPPAKGALLRQQMQAMHAFSSQHAELTRRAGDGRAPASWLEQTLQKPEYAGIGSLIAASLSHLTP